MLLGKDMTYFQSWHWCQLCSHRGLKKSRYWRTVYALVYRDNELIMIAPFWILKKNFRYLKKSGCYFANETIGWNDYSNFIYKIFDGNALDALLREISGKWNVRDFYFNKIIEDTASYEWLQSSKLISSDKTTPSVRLYLPESFEQYYGGLTKNARQNLRTARNRIIKDGKLLKIIHDDVHIDKDKCAFLRRARVVKKNKQQDFKLRLYLKLRDLFAIKPPFWLPTKVDNHTHFLSAYIDDNLCAFFGYVSDENNKTISVMNVGIDDKYARYSPGMLAMYSLVQSRYEDDSIRGFDMIDFTLGAEKYKYALGGVTMPVHHLKLKMLL